MCKQGFQIDWAIEALIELISSVQLFNSQSLTMSICCKYDGMEEGLEGRD